MYDIDTSDSKLDKIIASALNFIMRLVLLWLAIGILVESFAIRPEANIFPQQKKNEAHVIEEIKPPTLANIPPPPEIITLQNNNEDTAYIRQKINTRKNGNVAIGVFGDSMADGLWAGLYKEIGGARGISLYKFSQQSTGLTNYDYVDIAEEARKAIEEKPINIAIIIVGTNDARGLSGRGQLIGYGSPKWEKNYKQRIDELIQIFKEKNIAVYWVGLPIMRDEIPQKSARDFGRIFKNRAQANEISFISTIKASADKNGKYSDFLQLPKDNMPQIYRKEDGIHFQMEGYRFMAFPVIEIINRDFEKLNLKLEPKSYKNLH